jgi:Ca2+-transporting ATPase
MSRRRALVRKLAAVETLGATNVICTDKTGTLTVGEMTVRQLWTDRETYDVQGEGYAPTGGVFLHGAAVTVSENCPLAALARNLVGCNNAHLMNEAGAWKVIGDPTEGALLAAGYKLDRKMDTFYFENPRLGEIPFDSDRKRRTVTRRYGDRMLALTNGAPDILLDRCSHWLTVIGPVPLTTVDRERVAAANAKMADWGLRVLGCAYREWRQPAQPEECCACKTSKHCT